MFLCGPGDGGQRRLYSIHVSVGAGGWEQGGIKGSHNKSTYH